MKVATYLESWAVPYTVSSNNDISNLDPNIDTVYIAFAKPDNTYKKVISYTPPLRSVARNHIPIR